MFSYMLIVHTSNRTLNFKYALKKCKERNKKKNSKNERKKKKKIDDKKILIKNCTNEVKSRI